MPNETPPSGQRFGRGRPFQRLRRRFAKYEMVTASPPVPPRVVARIFTIQDRRITYGTLATTSDFLSRTFLPTIIYPASGRRRPPPGVHHVHPCCSTIEAEYMAGSLKDSWHLLWLSCPLILSRRPTSSRVAFIYGVRYRSILR